MKTQESDRNQPMISRLLMGRKLVGTLVIFSFLLSLMAAGCASSGRTYRNYQLDPEYPYAWVLNLRGGDDVLFYDFSQVQIIGDSLRTRGTSSSQRNIALDEVTAIEKVDTKKPHAAAVGLGVMGALVGAVIGGRLAAKAAKTSSEPKNPNTNHSGDGEGWSLNLDFDIDLTPAFAGLGGAFAGIAVGGMAGGLIGAVIESTASREKSDFSNLTSADKSRVLLEMKHQYEPKVTSSVRIIKIVRQDGSTLEGEVVLFIDQELIIIRTSDGEVKVPWPDIRSFEDTKK